MPIPTQEAIQAQQPQDGSGVATYEGPNWRTLGLAGQLTEKTGGEMQAAAASQQQLNAKQDEYMAQDAANKLKAALGEARAACPADRNEAAFRTRPPAGLPWRPHCSDAQVRCAPLPMFW